MALFLKASAALSLCGESLALTATCPCWHRHQFISQEMRLVPFKCVSLYRLPFRFSAIWFEITHKSRKQTNQKWLLIKYKMHLKVQHVNMSLAKRL